MTQLAPLLTGFALSLGLIVAIGAQNAFVLRQGVRREHVGLVVAFCAACDLALIAAGVAGLGAVLGTAPRLVTALSLGGAVFLGWYGISALRRALRTERLDTEPGGAALTRAGALARVAGFTLLNPHVYLDTVLLVGSVGAAQPAGAHPAFVLGAGLASLLWFTALGFGARFLTPLFARPLAWRVLDLLIGAMMLTLAAGLLHRVWSTTG
ncbi:LysE/ArgO family amino acid transporter [Rhodobacter capsulatus]|uniref:LysE/ArgO family amino acid transporter n=1 Tax=Rhodobacter capsulatus TaxID=1061 RepID=UPI0003D32BCC|nr:LysE/ArgO family amino acid transporter [Rhodobacter capsulatus]ETD02594.1 amino acid transporter [Rhodobacter capsulatus DE442]ETD78692.1 amino acid transporter [Rhodobacter capsulatus R121]ETE54658.1 amino acid transporter [Rhodobacter capsulatus Y262]